MLLISTRVFRCVDVVYLHKNQHNKLDSYAIRYVFLGYAVYKKGYHCHDLVIKKMYEIIDITFLDSEHFLIIGIQFFTLKGSKQKIRSEMAEISMAIMAK